MSDSYFFAVIPRYLKPEHSFAKSIKPNTNYRLVLYKGIQKCDQMIQPVKSRLVRGKIQLQSPELFFTLPLHNPTKNIQFNLKLYQQRPPDQQTQIGAITLISADYINNYINNQGSFYAVQSNLRDDLALVFDLFIEKSKYALTESIKILSSNNNRPSQQHIDQNRSQSSKSKQLVRSGDGFISPRKRIERKSGHKGKLRSRNNSRQDGDVSSEGSVASSRRRWRKSPPSKQGERFMHSLKKASPPKVNELQKAKSITKSETSAINVENKKNTKPQLNKKSYNQKPIDYLKFQNTKEIFDIQAKKKSQAGQSPAISQTKNTVQRHSVTKSTIVSQLVKSPDLHSLTPSQSTANQFSSPTNQPISSLKSNQPPISPRSRVTQPIGTNQSPTKQQIVSPRSSKNTFVDWEFKNTTHVLDVVPKKIYQSPQQSVQALQSPNGFKITSQKADIKKSNTKSQQKIEKDSNPLENQDKTSQNQPIKLNLKRTESVDVQKPLETKVNYSSSNFLVRNPRENVQQSKVSIKMQGSVHEPELVLIIRDNKSQKTGKSIGMEQNAVKNERIFLQESGTLRGRLKQVDGQKKQNEEANVGSKATEQRKQLILYLISLVVSMFLIYHAMSPSRRV